MIVNAEKELIYCLVKAESSLRCAEITIIHKDSNFEEISRSEINLKCNYSMEEFNSFMNSLNFNYNNISERIIIIGTLWFEDSRLYGNRQENCESYHWTINKLPTIPFKLKK